MSIVTVGGIGLSGGGGATPGKKFTSQECLEALIQRIKDDPMILRNQVTLYTNDQVEDFNNRILPAALDPENWSRTSTHRPKKTEDQYGGSDKEVRTYENDAWLDEGHELSGVVTTEFGQVTDITIIAKW